MRVLFLLFIFSISIFLFPIFIHAQLGGEALTIEINPESPQPGEKVSATISSPSTNVDASNVTWTIDDKTVNQGLGLKRITFTAPEIGKIMTLKVNVNAFDGSIHTQTLTLSGARVTLLWEPRTYTPAFFPGRAKNTQGADIIFQAFPDIINLNGDLVPAKSLVYTWKKNGTVMPGVSGYGKDSFVFTDDIIDPSTVISVEVSTTNQVFRATDSVETKRSLPTIAFYGFSLLYGTDLGMQRETFSGSGEIGLRAVPLYFPILSDSRFIPPAMNWNLSDKDIDTRGLPFLIVQNQNGKASEGKVSVSIKNPNYFGEDTPRSATLKFEQ